MKALVIGGTGFLGHYIVEELLAWSHQVAVMSRSPAKAARLLPSSVEVVEGDVNTLDHQQWLKILAPFDKLVYAAGADERVRPDTDARAFYFRENVETCRTMLLAAREAGITHAAVLNSVFTHFNREHPEMELCEHHPYIASRVAQSEMVMSVSRGHFVATVLEVPWVFGDSREGQSQWTALVNYARVAAPMIAPTGGAIAISVKNVAKATLGALARTGESASLPIGDCQISWDELLVRLSELSGRSGKPVIRLPQPVFVGMTSLGEVAMRAVGVKSGLNFARMHEFLLAEISADLATSQQLLEYGATNVDAALAATVASVQRKGLVSRLRSWVDNVAARSRSDYNALPDVA
jgi:nucleoside-diphosphate-sugar epimerase